MALENNQIQNVNIDNEEISMIDLVKKFSKFIFLLKSKLKVIIFIGIIGGLMGLTIALTTKPTYKAVLTFAMDEDKGGVGTSGGGLGGALGLASSFGIDLGGGGGGAFAASNLAELMKSRLIVEKVLLSPIKINEEITTLAEYYIKINKLRDLWDKNSSLQKIHFDPVSNSLNHTIEKDSLLKTFYLDLINKDNLNILQKDRKVTILTIEVLNTNEIFAKSFCENLARETSNFYVQTKSKKARINVEVLRKQVDSVKNNLYSAISGVAMEVDNVYNLNPAYIQKGTPSKKKQVEVSSGTVILTNLSVQLELAKISLRKETPLIQEIDHPVLPLEKEKLSKLKSIIIGGFLGGCVSILYILFMEYYIRIKSNL